MTPAVPTCLLSFFAFCAGCAPDAAPLRQPIDVISVAARTAARAIDPMVVEVLPVQPPGRHPLIGTMRMENSASFRWDDAEFMMDMKEKAAAMGGNTIVYTDDDPCHAHVFYIPEDCGSHGGDEE